MLHNCHDCRFKFIVFLCLVLSCGFLYLISMSLIFHALMCPLSVSNVLPSVSLCLSVFHAFPSLSHLLVHLTFSSSCRQCLCI